MRTAVLGGGIMGGGIALALSRAGHTVTVVEPHEAARRSLSSALRDAVRTHPGVVPAVESELSAAGDAGLVIEAAPEDLDLKRSLWEELGRVASSSAILASNTSSLDVDVLAACVPDPSRVLATHWFNPAYEVECVEVAPGRETRPDVLDATCELLRAAGKRPVVVRNVAGFVANRIQFAAIREALLCVEEGMSPEDVDEIVRTSFAPRLAALGPLSNADLGGLDTYLSIFETLRRAHGERFSPPDLLDALVRDGRFGTKTAAGVFEYPPGAAVALATLRDQRLTRIIAAVGEADRNGG